MLNENGRIEDILKGHSEGEYQSFRKYPWIYASNSKNLGLKSHHQGWKIHISFSSLELNYILKEVIPYLTHLQFDFKIIESSSELLKLNSGYGGDSQVGKALTVYLYNQSKPFEILEDLHRRLPFSNGPLLLNHIKVAPTGACGLRFGKICPQEFRVDINGDFYVPVFVNGKIIDDSNESEINSEKARDLARVEVSLKQNGLKKILLENDEYKVIRTIKSTNYQLVLEATFNSKVYIIKQALKGYRENGQGRDCRHLLENEFSRILSLRDKNLFPNVNVDLIKRCEDYVLVREKIEGKTLGSLPRSLFLNSFEKVIDKVEGFHREGWVHGDIKLDNIILTPSGDLEFIDFENSNPIGSEISSSHRTPGYVHPELRVGEKYTKEMDYYSLFMMYFHGYFAVNPFFFMNRESIIDFVDDIGEKPLFIKPYSDMNLPIYSGTGAKLNIEGLVAFSHSLIRQNLKSSIVSKNYLPLNRSMEKGLSGNLFAASLAESFNPGTVSRSLLREAAAMLINPSREQLPAGLFNGLCGESLALLTYGTLFNDIDAIRRGRNRFIDASKIENFQFDIYHGLAGQVYCGVLLSTLDKDFDYQPILLQLVQTIMENIKFESGNIYWECFSKSGCQKPQIGMAHGSTGIALALHSWGKLFGERDAIDLARRIVENILDKYLINKGYIPHDYSVEAPTSQIAWCHGLGGVLLASLHMDLDDHYIEKMKNVFYASRDLNLASLCHGLAGQLNLIKTLEVRKCNEGRSMKAEIVLKSLYHRIKKDRRGELYWNTEMNEAHLEGLMTGTTGVALSIINYASSNGDDVFSLELLSNLNYQGTDYECSGTRIN